MQRCLEINKGCQDLLGGMTKYYVLEFNVSLSEKAFSVRASTVGIAQFNLGYGILFNRSICTPGVSILSLQQALEI